MSENSSSAMRTEEEVFELYDMMYREWDTYANRFSQVGDRYAGALDALSWVLGRSGHPSFDDMIVKLKAGIRP